MDYRTDIGYEAEPQAAHDFERQMRPMDDFMSYLREYTRERPEMVALTCFCVGFVLGWKLKPW
jgi:hypothetical protein